MKIRDKIKKKLIENYSSLTRPEKIVYFFTVRLFMSKYDRDFFEGSKILQGQLMKAERIALYETVRKERPDYCFEIGTYTGGGSTFFISQALKDNGHGTLITTEIDERLYKKAKQIYSIFYKKQNKRIIFINDSSTEVFEKYIKTGNKNLYFLDGAENGVQTLEQYEFFKKFIKSGDMVVFHDWNSEKTVLVKPLLANDNSFYLAEELKRPESVGLAIFIKK